MSRSFVAKKPKLRLDDEVRFLSTWLQSPLKTGALSPSGAALPKARAAEIDPSVPGPVVELGPGTGPVTEAILARGIMPQRLFVRWFNRGIFTLLRTTVSGGDAL